MTTTTKELLALVDSLQESITDWGDNMRNEAMADLLDHTRRIRAALPALCAEVEALRKDAERLNNVIAFLQSDSTAITYQSLGQYRRAAMEYAK